MAKLRPDADQSVGSWTDEGGSASNLYQSIDESVASDADYVQSEVNPSSSSYLVRLSDPAGTVNTDGPAVIRYRYEKDGTSKLNLTVDLIENATTPVTRATVTHLDIGTAVVQSTMTLSTAEKTSITNWSDLYLRFTADVGGQVPDTVFLLEDGPVLVLEDNQELSLEDGISLSASLVGSPATSVNITLSSSVTGTLYWVATNSQTPPDLGSSGFDTVGSASGSSQVSSTTGSASLDLSGLGVGTWYIHTVVQRTSDKYYTTRYTNSTTIV